jgi:hypothetical protein
MRSLTAHEWASSEARPDDRDFLRNHQPRAVAPLVVIPEGDLLLPFAVAR